MGSGGIMDRDEIGAAFDALDHAIDAVAGFCFDALTPREWLALLERTERVRRRLPVPEHRLINHLSRQASTQELGGKLDHALADRLRISRAEASRRVKEAADLGPRHGLTGEPLPPVLAATAAAQREGTLGAGHVAVIRGFSRRLPGWIDAATRERVEADLAAHASHYRPEELNGLAHTLQDCLNPDGTYTDEDRARQRGLTLGNQQPDGMSQLRGVITPELRATLEAVQAKLGAPGMCNPHDQTPCVDGAPSQDAIDRDTRSGAQRNHDALLAALRALLASGELGQHNGLPAAIIVTTTLADLEAAAGHGLTGGGTIVPMSDVIRLGRHAHHYLAIFDKGKALALYHTKRLASPGQRIVLYAKDRGCTAPGCDVKGYYCEVHHTTDYATCHTTDINDLTFACGPHHRMLTPGAWTTRKNTRGDTEWRPPAHLERGQPRTNAYHHPERFLNHDEDDDPV
ncbi:HNH endonuclease signature motif containing protein [Mycobacterium sp.]|uniref:HNH endonuclease signature motif containing protein n=1 Tax=Mycobacterium sp. TaxID=1785 RepID=UPI0012287550|nr:HNH endonuclease signature motif containing protein [Mycobacterium sp.]TAM63335.1 MAG: HNH endonuclease [Mycobacterium sp.]